MQEGCRITPGRQGAFSRWLDEDVRPLIWAAWEAGYNTNQAIELLKLWALEGIEGNMPD